MNSTDVLFARVYLTEGAHQVDDIFNYLKDDAGIDGASVFRAVSGFGQTGTHSSSLVDLSLDLPVVIEFFDAPDKIMPAVEHLTDVVKAGHVVYWRASKNS
jgi:uncharacterized protein